ncbi:MAG: hypothetical protein M3Y42_14105 [Actinomycetota bacterium]|nr:hypothetical protein [Actinomycetota bacterium]MDQ2958084.1 hypothetical protein [Actinomycetota bacterium]
MTTDSPDADLEPSSGGGTVTAEAVPTVGINHLQLAVLTVLFGGLLAAGAHLSNLALLVAIAVLQAVLIPCWVLGSGLPGRIGALMLGTLAAGGADAACSYWHDSGYSPVLGVLGVAIPLMFAHQLSRGVVRTRVVESLSGITLLLIAVTALAGLIVLRRQGNGDTVTLALVAASAAGLVAGHLTDAVLPAPRFDPSIDRGLPAILVGVVVGAAVGLLTLRNDIDFAGGRAAFVGAAMAAVAGLLSIGATFAEARTAAPEDSVELPPVAPRLARLRPAAAVTITLALTAPAAYVLANALTS